MRQTLISADSHITEPPNVYRDYIDSKYKDRAPYLQKDAKAGDMFIMGDPLPPIPIGIIAAAGKKPTEIRFEGVTFEDMHKGGWEPNARLAEQDQDGISAEIIYPSIGMMLCNHPDFDLKRACFKAYNTWLAEYCGEHPDRLLGAGQIAMHDPKEAIADLELIKKQGLRGVMLPGNPQQEDYDQPCYDDFFKAALEMDLPLSFHILTGKQSNFRGSALNGFMQTIRGCQDILGMLVFGGVFDRHPDLKVVCVEADAGWAPHYMYRMDHAYLRHRHWITPGQELRQKPSDYFADNIYITFQDDWSAFGVAKAGMINTDRLMWANDFPHSDSTWPWSQPLLAQHAKGIDEAVLQRIFYKNVAELYNIDMSTIQMNKANLDPGENAAYNETPLDFKHADTLANSPSSTNVRSFIAMED